MRIWDAIKYLQDGSKIRRKDNNFSVWDTGYEDSVEVFIHEYCGENYYQSELIFSIGDLDGEWEYFDGGNEEWIA